MIFNRGQLYKNWRNKGCFESYCSGSGISDRFKELTNQTLSLEKIMSYVHKGDPLACALLDEMADYLAMGIINLVAMANLQKVVLTGGVTHVADYFLPRVQATLDRQLFTNTHVTMELSELREKAPLYGIAILALSAIYPAIQFMPDAQIN